MKPFNPDSVERLKDRLPKAFKHIIKVTNEGAEEGQLTENNIFDFDDGLRLIVSMDQFEQKPPVVHVSASASPGTEAYRLVHGDGGTDGFFRRIYEAWDSLGRTGFLWFVNFSTGKGVPHFVELNRSEAMDMLVELNRSEAMDMLKKMAEKGGAN